MFLKSKRKNESKDLDSEILQNVMKLEDDISNKRLTLNSPLCDSPKVIFNSNNTSNNQNKSKSESPDSKSIKSKISKINKKASVSFQDTTTEFGELLQDILENKNVNNNTQHEVIPRDTSLIISRLRLMTKKLYDIKTFDVSEYYNTYENSEMSNSDQVNFYDSISDFIFGYGETWKLMNLEEYNYYNKILNYEYDSYFNFDGSDTPLLMNLFQNGDSEEETSLKFNLSSISDPLRIDGYFKLFDTKTHKLIYNNNSYGDLFSLIDNIFLVEIRKRLNEIPKEYVETWFENYNLDPTIKIEDYVYKYVDKHGWINTNGFYLCKSIEFVNEKMNEILSDYKKYLNVPKSQMIDSIYQEIYKSVEFEIENFKSNFDTVMIELKNKSSMYKKQELIEILSKPLQQSVSYDPKVVIDKLQNNEVEDVFKEIKEDQDVNRLLNVDFEKEDSIDSYDDYDSKNNDINLEDIHKDHLMTNSILKKINVTPVYKNTLDINDALFKLSSSSKYYSQFSSKSARYEDAITSLRKLAQTTTEKIDFVHEFVNNFTSTETLENTNILFIIIYIHSNMKKDELKIDVSNNKIVHPIISKWNTIINYISNM
jgi:hypothetical protein